ncbi:hypothetical protein CAAN1_01S06876 [[Candida] anglica]|uniref:Survival motor neuron interacting protein 1-domain-containing protein n=1 Tax=[Candida] anglica TaxID=148631 RepID=A0ABP0EJT8_9ASCO
MRRAQDIRSDARIKRCKTDGSEGLNHQHADSSDKQYTQGPLDEIFGQHSAFPVELDGDEESNEVMQYLASVRNEAELDTPVHFVKRSKEKTKDDTIVKQSNEQNSTIDYNTTSTIPDEINWQENLLSTFLSLKEEVQIQTILPNSATSQPLPSSASAWRELIFTSKEPPTVRFFFTELDHSTTIKLLIYSTQWLSTNTPSMLSRWIYMLFLRLDNLLDHNECAIVRSLAQKAIKLRTKPNLSPISRYTIDMIITIVGKYYHQKDLLEIFQTSNDQLNI